ncbi:hypothetical protein MNBD_GAMMA17-2039 [hydrothermal vent metagenome]|uniref:Uncharacterized protein n=1 Tax=hydrothermal vent metagenome TaxID=652676 RepID=A0A3B0Z956_9ZZZZ
MSEQCFQVIINGQLAEGAELSQTRQNMAKLFKAKLEAVEPMFSGKRVSVKKNLDQATAKKYQQAIIKAGLKAGIAPMPNTAPAEQRTTTNPATVGIATASIAAVGSTMDDRSPPPAANIDTSAYGMDEVGITLDETPLADEPEIDISAFSMDEVGIIIDETPPVQTAEIDVSTISMQETGVDLVEYKTPAKADYDLSAFSMAEAGEILVEYTHTAPAEIDTGDLELK